MKETSRLWIVSADRSEARIFQKLKFASAVQKILMMHNEAAHLRNQDLNADKPGRVRDRFGSAKHSYSLRSRDPVEMKARLYAQQIARVLKEGRIHDRYSHLILCCPPRFLGELQEAIDSKTAGLMLRPLKKDFVRLDDREAKAAIDKLVRPLFPLSPLGDEVKSLAG